MPGLRRQKLNAVKGSVLNGGKLRLNKIEFFIGKCGNQELTAAMDFTKAEENKEFRLRTKANGSQLDIKNSHFNCILKWLFFIDLHLNLPPFGSVLEK